MTNSFMWLRTTVATASDSVCYPGEEIAWKTQEGEWRETPHPLLSQHDVNSLEEPTKFFWPAGIIRYRFLPGTESFFEFCDYNTDTFVGPFRTMYQAQCAFDEHHHHHKETTDGQDREE